MILTGDNIVEMCSGLIHEPKQKKKSSLHLTVKSIKKIISKGSLDFGGSEEEAADLEAIKPKPEKPDDKYGWWDLQGGTYIVFFNEELSIKESGMGFILPLERLLGAGATLAPRVVMRNDEEGRGLFSLLTVGSGGLKIKENSRIAELVILRNE